MCNSTADIIENDWLQYGYDVLECLLWEHSRPLYRDGEGRERHRHICWGTDNYEGRGAGYACSDEITVESVTGENTLLIRPRALKSREEQEQRTRDKAEVFTPSWVCNAQNNLIDEAWFGRKDVFNTEYTDGQGRHLWRQTEEKITFPADNTWKDYVRDIRMEITCGEAPYIVSRYDTTTGELIPIEQRIGLLDRKLRVVGENTQTTGEWLEWAQEAYRSIYAYEWQGDNLLIARESMLASFVEYYCRKFGRQPLPKSVQYIAYIISWNVWQMDGLKGVVPNSCGERRRSVTDLFGNEAEEVSRCEGCLKDDIRRHNGIYCLIKDWRAKDPQTGKLGKRIRFIDLIR